MDVGPGGRSSQLSAAARQNGAELVLQLACWTAATGQGVRTDIAGATALNTPLAFESTGDTICQLHRSSLDNGPRILQDGLA